MDGNKRKKDTVTDAEKLLKGEKTGKEINRTIRFAHQMKKELREIPVGEIYFPKK